MKKKIAFLSSGLGNVSRGFETSTAVWFNEIKNTEKHVVKLFCGGNYEHGIKVWNFSRDGRVASFLRKLNVVKDGCRLEQITFSVGLLFHLFRYRPNIIWLQEATLGNMLIVYRRIFGLDFKLIFCDGAPAGAEVVKKFDYIIFLHQESFNAGIDIGIPEEKCFLIPYITLSPAGGIKKADARKQLNISSENFVVICVAAWSRHHKRIDYLLEEMSKFSFANITLLLCGQPESDTEKLMALSADIKNIDIRWYTFSPKDLSLAYLSADLFVLTSLREGLPMVLIESALYNLPVICHPHNAGKFIFGDDYIGLTDLTVEGNLFKKIDLLKGSADLQQIGSQTKQIVESKFDRKKLTSKLLDLIDKIEC